MWVTIYWKVHKNPVLFSIPIFYFFLSIKIVLSFIFWNPSLTLCCVCQWGTKHKIGFKPLREMYVQLWNLQLILSPLFVVSKKKDLRAGSFARVNSCVEFVYVELCL